MVLHGVYLDVIIAACRVRMLGENLALNCLKSANRRKLTITPMAGPRLLPSAFVPRLSPQVTFQTPRSKGSPFSQWDRE